MIETWHGTAGGYTNHRCRCSECRGAWADYMRTYQRSIRAANRRMEAIIGNGSGSAGNTDRSLTATTSKES